MDNWNGFIPVRTGQILNSSKKSPRLTYCRFLLPWIYDKFSMYYFFEMYFADNTFGSISPQNPHIFVITVQRTHPRMYGGRSDDSFPTILTHTVHPRVHGARMHQHLLQNHPGMAHPRVYGADAISLSRVPLMLRFIPAYTGQILNSSSGFL